MGDCTTESADPAKDLEELESQLKEDPLSGGASLSDRFGDITDDELPGTESVFEDSDGSFDEEEFTDSDGSTLDGNGLNMDAISGKGLGEDLDIDYDGKFEV